MNKGVKLIECPRDAMQGINQFIPTQSKIKYHNQLLRCGFNTIDIGSFVSPKAIPQLKDTSEVLDKLDDNTTSDLLVIVGNLRGAHEACKREEIKFLGFPFSVSEKFLERNINSTIEDSLYRIGAIKELASVFKKELVIYISMAFGNPYGEHWDADEVARYTELLINEFEIDIISLSDTIGSSTPESIEYLFGNLIPQFPDMEIGAHLHTRPDEWKEKVIAAYESGCLRFDGAIKGFGGCPMAQDSLIGNMPMENLISFFNDHEIDHGVKENEFERAVALSLEIFPH